MPANSFEFFDERDDLLEDAALFCQGLRSLPDAKPGKNLSQQIIAGEFTRDPAQRLVRQAQFLGKQVQHLIAVRGMPGGGPQMSARRLQRTHVPLARQPGGLRPWRPAGNSQQPGAQGVQSGSGMGGNQQGGIVRSA